MQMTIYELPVSPNGPKGLLRMHWSARSRYNAKWQMLVRCQIPHPMTPPAGRHVVTITQVRKRTLDPDNLYASCKPVLDALVHWGLIADDGEDYIDLQCRQYVNQKFNFTSISIQPQRGKADADYAQTDTGRDQGKAGSNPGAPKPAGRRRDTQKRRQQGTESGNRLSSQDGQRAQD